MTPYMTDLHRFVNSPVPVTPYLIMIDKHMEKFELYYSLLVEWNQRFNLTAITERDEVFARHFEDSLAAADYIKEGAYVCDIGSGAGFPGLPLKIVRPDLNVVLFDSVNKKIAFLNEVISRLGLSGIEAVHSRAEDAAALNRYRERFGVAVCRAVAPLPVLCEYALPLIKVGGNFIAYKTEAAVETETASVQNALKILNGKITDVIPYSLKEKNGGEIKLALIIIEKTALCPLKYPRGGNKPRLNPL